MTRPILKKMKKVAVWGLTMSLTTAAVLMTVTIGWRPLLGAKARPLTNRQFDRTPERLARGRYLVEGVGGCFDCHAQVEKDFKDLKPGTNVDPTKVTT